MIFAGVEASGRDALPHSWVFLRRKVALRALLPELMSRRSLSPEVTKER